MKFLLAGTAAAMISLGSMASASLFTIVGGNADSIPGGVEGDQPVTPENQVIDFLGIGTYNPGLDRNELDVYENGISIVMNKTKQVRVELLGWEAGFENSFELDGQVVGKGLNGVPSTTFFAKDPVDSFVTGLISSLDFSFLSRQAPDATVLRSVSNGDANEIPGPNFVASCINDPSSRSCNSMYIFYDDDNVVNDNHDDLVIRISAVPLPAGMLLMMTGLGALALRRRMAA